MAKQSFRIQQVMEILTASNGVLSDTGIITVSVNVVNDDVAIISGTIEGIAVEDGPNLPVIILPDGTITSSTNFSDTAPTQEGGLTNVLITAENYSTVDVGASGFCRILVN